MNIGDDVSHDAILATLSDRCCEVAGADAAGVMLVAPSGVLEIAAWSSDAAPFLAYFEMQTWQGPCLDSYRTNRPVSAPDLGRRRSARRWPLLVPAARKAGLRSLDAVPLRRGHRVIGGLSLLHRRPLPPDTGTLSAVQAIADLATDLLRAGADGRSGPVAGTIDAVRDRVIIEQAKGMIAERNDVSIGQADAAIRDLARVARRPVRDLASDIVNGTLDAAAVAGIRTGQRRVDG